MFEYKVTGKLLGRGRTGVFTTPHGEIRTPVFMPVGTHASVKSVNPADLTNIKAQIILANNYHLFLRPGSNVIAAMGGLHSFMNWDKPILTDSGGFQVWSLGSMAKIKNNGVEFRSHLDGSLNFLSPEIAIESEVKLGADIIVAFDQCTKDTATVDEARAAVELTQNWLLRSIKEWQKNDTGRQALFGIIQGALHKDIRREAAQFVVEQNTPGIALGGETIGYNMAGTKQVIDWISDLLPEDKPRYTMGLGLTPSDVLTAITLGIDMFDCVAPTRLARNGALYTGKVIIKDTVIPANLSSSRPPASAMLEALRAGKRGSIDIDSHFRGNDNTIGSGMTKEYFFESEFPNERLNIGNKQFETDTKPIDPDCDCDTCRHFTRAYLHHLFRTKELLYYSLASLHNLRMMIKTVEDTKKLASRRRN